jgi:8-oxo-dGTP diphosphatase
MKVVTAAIVIQDGKVLLARRGPKEKLAGYWEFPGGKVEKGESLAECLCRELHEELGVEAEIGEVMAQSEYRYDHGAFILVGLCATLKSNDLFLSVHDLAEWVPISDLLKYQLAEADIALAIKLQEATCEF